LDFLGGQGAVPVSSHPGVLYGDERNAPMKNPPPLYYSSPDFDPLSSHGTEIV
jgi:hypothetical protein